MKRLLAAGSGDIFQICHVVRGVERGKLHNAEFTLVEWYRLGFSLEQLMAEVQRWCWRCLGRPRPCEFADVMRTRSVANCNSIPSMRPRRRCSGAAQALGLEPRVRRTATNSWISRWRPGLGPNSGAMR